ncbi:MAG: 1-deoxy-D-xylulose-5-phosphate synthase, partial [Candidatus Faecivicinus sp.]|nr:1-deoxy-D-xylulose-5-phosphate synthase [Candidatus Faecivicinus sp.]
MREIRDPSEIKQMNIRELEALAQEIREEIIRVVSEKGGHLASNLGAVELTIALHYVFSAPEDKLIFDVGHQAYAHKLLTGRLSAFEHLRERGGASGFPQLEESEYDSFAAGHASNAISAALGMARTRDIMHGENQVIAVVGNGALTGGMCYEALNDAGQSSTRMIVVLNDNEMSIAKNVGAMQKYLTHLRQSRTYRNFKRRTKLGLERIPVIGMPILRVIEKCRDLLKSMLLDGEFFSALGFEYIGPIDGHDLKQLIRVLKRSNDLDRPVLLHVLTQKGRGYEPAENHPDRYHGVAPFYIESGESKRSSGAASSGAVAARRLIELAESDIRICTVTAAMPGGTGMAAFQSAYPDRFFDVGIAEEHAVTMAAGMAASGMKPYVAIYSTFLERAYDQILIDVCRNALAVTFLIDRAGLVGADGATHQGVFDLSYLRSMPNMIIASPRDGRELKRMIAMSASVPEPMAIRYPK